MDAPELTHRNFLRLIAADYRAYSESRGESKTRRRILALPRFLLNPSLHAVTIIRLSNASPAWLYWFWRNLMIWKHSMEIGHRAIIGPGLMLAHPYGIGVTREVRIGRGVRIMHGVSIGPSTTTAGLPVIGDRAVILAHAMIWGEVEIGAESIIGAGAYVDFDVPPGGLARANRAELLPGRAAELRQGALKGL